MVTLHSLLAVGPLPPSVAPDATSLLDLVVDLQSEVLWESGVYEIGATAAGLASCELDSAA